jgi:hypothetical protein
MCYHFVKCRKCIFTHVMNISSSCNFCALPFQMWVVPYGGHSLNQTEGNWQTQFLPRVFAWGEFPYMHQVEGWGALPPSSVMLQVCRYTGSSHLAVSHAGLLLGNEATRNTAWIEAEGSYSCLETRLLCHTCLSVCLSSNTLFCMSFVFDL